MYKKSLQAVAKPMSTTASIKERAIAQFKPLKQTFPFNINPKRYTLLSFFEKLKCSPHALMLKKPLCLLGKKFKSAHPDIEEFLYVATKTSPLIGKTIIDKERVAHNAYLDSIYIPEKFYDLHSLPELHQKHGKSIISAINTPSAILKENGWNDQEIQSLKSWIFFLRHEAGHRFYHQHISKTKKLTLAQEETFADFFAASMTHDPEVLDAAAHSFKKNGEKRSSSIKYEDHLLLSIGNSPVAQENIKNQYGQAALNEILRLYNFIKNDPHQNPNLRAEWLLNRSKYLTYTQRRQTALQIKQMQQQPALARISLPV